MADVVLRGSPPHHFMEYRKGIVRLARTFGRGGEVVVRLGYIHWRWRWTKGWAGKFLMLQGVIVPI